VIGPFDKTCRINENGRMKKQHIQLSQADREYLEVLISKGELMAKAYRRALALLELDRGKTYTEVSRTLQVTIPTLSGWATKYLENGVQVLQDRPRTGRPVVIDGDQRAKITALACSDPPEGYAQWSLRLIADKVVELGYCEHISHTEVGQILKKTN
jgi:putative transposase